MTLLARRGATSSFASHRVAVATPQTPTSWRLLPSGPPRALKLAPREEAASYQAMGFFERLLELAGATEIDARFTARSWSHDERTRLELSWKSYPYAEPSCFCTRSRYIPRSRCDRGLSWWWSLLWLWHS